MRVFISWSGETMKLAAEALRDWMRVVLVPVTPWVSSQDIMSGARSMHELAEILSTTKVGIVCVSPQTQASPWINFEAGALSRSLDEGRVIPFLVGLTPPDLKPPLGQFQAVDSTSLDDVTRMIVTINRELPSPVPDEVVGKLLDTFWPDLERNLGDIREQLGEGGQKDGSATRPDRELLEESVLLLRAQASSFSEMHERLNHLRSRGEVWNVHAQQVHMRDGWSVHANTVEYLADMHFPNTHKEVVETGSTIRILIWTDVDLPEALTSSLTTLATNTGMTIEVTTRSGTEVIRPEPPF